MLINYHSFSCMTHVKYFHKRNIKIHVNIIPPYKINLSWADLLSISLNTVLESPNVFATSKTFLWAPLRVILCSRIFVRMLDPELIMSPISRLAFCRLLFCCNAWSIIMDVSPSFGAKSLDRRASRSLASSSFWYLQVQKLQLITKVDIFMNHLSFII